MNLPNNITSAERQTTVEAMVFIIAALHFVSRGSSGVDEARASLYAAQDFVREAKNFDVTVSL